MKNIKYLLSTLVLSLSLSYGFGQNTTVSNIVNLAGEAPTHLVNDGYKAFSQFSTTNPIAVDVIGLKVPDGYGFGIDVSTAITNNPVQLGFGVFAWQEKDSSGKIGWGFADATFNISYTTIETIPLINIPIQLKLESGPGYVFSGKDKSSIVEQSAIYGDITLHPFKQNIIIGGGVAHCSASAFVNKAIPMAHIAWVIQLK